MKITAEPRSDQWNADDFVGGARVFTIAGVKVGAAEQKSHTVDPLTAADIIAWLRAEWRTADPERQAVIEAEVKTLQGEEDPS